MMTISANSPHEKGFTLVEMAIVLAIVTLLLVGLLPTISGQIEQQRRSETRKQLNDIQQALIGFAIINGRLPCPATAASNGLENPDGGPGCTNFYNGFVPGATLGITSLNEEGQVLDAWNNPIRYAVTSWDSTAPSPVLSDVYTTNNGMQFVGISNLKPNLIVCSTATGITTTDCGAADAKLTAGDGVPVVLFSTGPNGAYGGTGVDEAANLDGTNVNNNRTFVSHTPTSTGAPNGEFDDMVVWISHQTLLSRMVSANKLP